MADRDPLGASAMLPSRDEFFALWQINHSAPDLDPRNTFALRWFLTFTYACARPFARRRVNPNVITACGLLLGALALIATKVAPALGGLVVLLSSLTDGVDGAVAALSGRSSKIGFVLDSVVDRLSDTLFVIALVLVGASERLAGIAVAVVWLLEYTRARAGNAGLGEIGVVTIGERPTRVLAVGLSLVGAQVLSARAVWCANLGAGIIVVASSIGFLQLGRHLRRVLQ
jgi:phosphatidylglycerophosphate synthase